MNTATFDLHKLLSDSNRVADTYLNSEGHGGREGWRG